MNTQELDRLLCERLGIKGDIEHNFDCHLETYDWGNPWRGEPPKCSCIPHINYPALSTTGDGMLKLMETLRYMNHEVVIEHLLEGLCYVRVGPAKWQGCLPVPLSLALAAAAALGIEVPE